ncbi:uncharacterized protein LOC118204286 [Stegodyphus dumicola]|uniref:uncharacterized protein LOC118204286 n=1 Tax=Stegodyphus dumicola TaxID=202533 RepID=UPI0015AC4011|nr:uncharacterized protein LOC118204286 [Stegodyphus dumicola]
MIQRPFALLITRAYRTTSTDALNVLAGLLPLHIRIEEEAARQTLKQLSQITQYKDEIYNPSDYEGSLINVQIHPAKKGIGVRILHQNATDPEVKVCLYTDGSKIDNGVGSAFVAVANQNILHTWQGHLHENNTVFQSEMLAIKEALTYLVEQRHNRAIIFTDSLSSIHAINNPDHSSPIVTAIQKILRENYNSQYFLKWVKAHAGHAWNEFADTLAKQAAAENPTEHNIRQYHILWPMSHFKKKHSGRKQLTHGKMNGISAIQDEGQLILFQRCILNAI